MAGGGSARGKNLRTTYSCPGVWKHDHGEIIPDDQGNNTTTSYVALDDTHRMTVGDAAENQVALNPVTTDARHLIGRKYSSDSGLMFAPRNSSVNENSPSLPPKLPLFFATSSYSSTPLLQPFPPPTPSPFLMCAPPATPIPDFGPLYTREEVRDALLRVVQKDEVIDMFYQELYTPH